MPGEYQNPVELTGSATFSDCGNGYPGIYRFDQGLWINPGLGDTVTGNNVVIATQAPYPVAGNVPVRVRGPPSWPAQVEVTARRGLLPTPDSGPSGHGTPARDVGICVRRNQPPRQTASSPTVTRPSFPTPP